MTTIFSTKKQIIKVNGKYAARYRKWWQLHWRYIGANYIWNENYFYYGRICILEDTLPAAYLNLKGKFPDIEVLNEY